MKTKSFFIRICKLLLCSLAFVVGAFVGGVIVTILGLESPPMPEGVDGNLAFLILMLETPLLVLTLVLLGRGLGGRFLSRALTLSFFTWVVYSLNTAIESLAFTASTVEGAMFTVISFLLPSVFCGLFVAWLFPPDNYGSCLVTKVKSFFGSRKTGAWTWRIAVSAVVFVPIYLIFGSLVAPFTSQYFQESMYGLRMPNQVEIILVLLVRSVLFLLACLPIIIAWQRSKWRLLLNLGFALFILVGFIYMLGAYYMPLVVRLPHTLEILADSFAHAGLLVLLLSKGGAS